MTLDRDDPDRNWFVTYTDDDGVRRTIGPYFRGEAQFVAGSYGIPHQGPDDPEPN